MTASCRPTLAFLSPTPHQQLLGSVKALLTFAQWLGAIWSRLRLKAQPLHASAVSISVPGHPELRPVFFNFRAQPSVAGRSKEDICNPLLSSIADSLLGAKRCRTPCH